MDIDWHEARTTRRAIAINACLRLDEQVHADHETVELTAILWAAPEGGFSALNPETGTTSQGETHDEALRNLAEATALYLEEFPLPRGERPVITTFHIADVA